MSLSGRLSVLVAASGASWEAPALHQLAAGRQEIVLLKRCVDLNDLLATATTGQAQVAVVAAGLPGFDVECVALLRRSGVGVVLVAEHAELQHGAEAHVGRLGVDQVIESGSIATVNEAIVAAGGNAPPVEVPPDDELSALPAGPEAVSGRMLAVWGPTGAPGRTTVAVGLAAELSHRSHETFLLDVDTYGGAVAQHLGVLDEMSGLLGAARLANAGHLDHDRLASLARRVNPALRVLTGLPRADRWREVRAGAFEQLLELAQTLGRHIVLDTGFSLEHDVDTSFGSVAPARNAMTLSALGRADEVVVVGSADPVGLARLARALVELLELLPGCVVRIVVNRARPSLGWGEHEVRAMIEGFVTPTGVHFLPYDRSAADRAMVSGKSLVELGDSPLRRSLADLATAVTGQAPGGARRGALRHRRAGTGR